MILTVSLTLALLLAPKAAPTNPAPERTETVKKGYYTFSPPASWTRTDERVMTKHEPAWELPRSKGDEAAVALVHRRLSDRADKEAGAEIRAAIDDWKKRWSGVAISERTQPVAGVPGAEAKVYVVDHVKDGRAVLAAIVDLSAVDARTHGAYTRVGAGLFEIEGPETRITGAKADFDAMVRSVGLTVD